LSNKTAKENEQSQILLLMRCELIKYLIPYGKYCETAL